MADQDAAFVAGPAGRPPTREEAEAMAAALFEQIAASRQADQADPAEQADD